MKKKIIGAFALTVLITGLLSVYAFIQREKSLELHWLTENSRSQLDLMGDLLQNDLEKMKSQMAQVAALMESGQIEEAQKNLGLFIGVAALNVESGEFLWKTQAPPRRADVAAQTNTVQSNAAQPSDEWAAQWIQKTKETKTEDNDLKFFVSQSPHGDVRSALSVQANIRDHRNGQINKVRLIGIRAQALFQDYIDKLKVQGVHTFLTTQTGLTLAHSVSEYVGNSMLGDRTYEQIRNDKNVFGTIVTQDVRGDDILSFYVKLPMGKLTLVSQWRKELWLATDWTFYGQGLFFILALSLLAGAVAQYLLKRFEGELVRRGMVREMMREVPLEIKQQVGDAEDDAIMPVTSGSLFASGASSAMATAGTSSPGAPLSTSSATSLVSTLSSLGTPSPLASSRSGTPSGVPSPSTTPLFAPAGSSGGRAISTPTPTPTQNPTSDSLPLLSRPPLLFSTPLVAPEVRDPQVSMKILDKVVSALRAPLLSVLGHVQMARLNPQGGALQSIETEVRSAKEVLDQVGQFSGQAHVPSVTVPLHEIVESALRHMEGSLLRNNIKIIREIPSDLAIKCDIDDFKTALVALFKNSIESMENSIRKTLFIRAQKVNNLIQFEIEDSGEGMTPENLVKALDPFFTTRSTLEHAGLGLSMVSGVLRQHSAQMLLKSKPSEGTTISIKLPASQEVVQPLAHCLASKTAARMESFATANYGSGASSGAASNAAFSAAQSSISNQPDPVHATTTESAMSEHELFKSLNLFDEEDSSGDFQFGRLEFKEEPNNNDEVHSSMSLGEKAAQEALQEVTKTYKNITTSMATVERVAVVEPTIKSESPVAAVPSKKLKKKEEPYSKIKVQIPRPEEKI